MNINNGDPYPDVTAMGSGWNPVSGWGTGNSGNYTYVAWQLHTQYINTSSSFSDVTPTNNTNYPYCYNQIPWTADGNIGVSMFLGGTGSNNCQTE